MIFNHGRQAAAKPHEILKYPSTLLPGVCILISPCVRLLDGSGRQRQKLRPAEAEAGRGQAQGTSPLTELLLLGLGSRGRRPLLLTRSRDGELAIYQVRGRLLGLLLLITFYSC